MERVFVVLTKAQRLQGMVSSLGVRCFGRVDGETHCASWVVGTAVFRRARVLGSVDRRKSQVQRRCVSLDCLYYFHSVGTPRQRRLASRRGCF
jgi:hypothetical protein